jgi:zinc transporter
MMTESPPEEGLVCAFQLGPPRRLGAEVLAEGASAEARWVHVNLVDARIRRWISAREDIPGEAKALLLDPEPRVRVESFEDGFAIALGDLHHDFEDDPDGFGMLRAYVTQGQILTARRRPIMSIRLLHAKVEHSTLSRDTTDMFELILRGHEEAVSSVVRRFADAVDDAEDEILAGHVKQQGSSLGRIRRLLARLRRHVHANGSVVAQVIAAQPAYWEQEHLELIRSCQERLEASAQDIELVSERARLLQEEIASLLSEATNKNLYLLSTMTTVLLPITLITGIFGMNLGGMPFADNPHGFAIVMGVISSGVVSAIVFLRQRNVV